MAAVLIAAGLFTTTQIVFAAIPTDGLVGYWKLDEGMGTSTVNSAGPSYNGTFVGSPMWTTGRVNGGLSFNDSDYVTMGAIPPILGQRTLTMGAWIRRDGINDYVLVGTKAVLGQGVSILAWWDGYISLEIDTGASESYGRFFLNDAQWHYVVMVFDGTKTGNEERLKGYVDGVPQTLEYIGTIPDVTSNSTTPFRLGRAQSVYSDGRIDEVVLYDRALSESEVQQLYTNTGAEESLPEVVSGGKPSLEHTPSEIELVFEKGDCTVDPATTLFYHAHDAAWVRFGLKPDLSDASPWLAVENHGIGSLDIRFPKQDGEQAAYVQFMSQNALRSPITSASIRVDHAGACGAAQTAAPSEAQAPPIPSDPSCIADFAHATIRPYLVMNDGRTITSESPHTLVRPLSSVETQYSFDVNGNNDFTDVVLHAENLNGRLYVHGAGFKTNAPHHVRGEVLAGDLRISDVALWDQPSEVVGDWRRLDLDGYPQICASDKVSAPHPGDLVQGNEKIVYYIGKDRKRHAFPDSQTFWSWYPNGSFIRTWPAYQLATFPLGASVTIRPGTGIQIATESGIYLITAPNMLRGISATLLQSLFGLIGRATYLLSVDVGLLQNYFVGSPISTLTGISANPNVTIDEALQLSPVPSSTTP